MYIAPKIQGNAFCIVVSYRETKKQLIYEIRDQKITKEIFQVNQTYIIAGSDES